MPVRTLIVDDSGFFRRSLIALLAADSGIEVVGEAANGEEAIRLARELAPDVITMDVQMPVMDGITAVRRLQGISDARIIMFSHLTYEGGRATVEALAAGAADFLPKTLKEISGDREAAVRELCNRIREIGTRTAPRRTPTSRTQGAPMDGAFEQARRPATAAATATTPRRISPELPRLVVVGTSTGGPVALQRLLTGLPASASAPILIVQHMPANFTRAFAERLDSLCQIRVKEAEDGDVPQAGHAYLAPGGRQMRLERRAGALRIVVEDGSPALTYKPSVDVLFQSVAALSLQPVLAVVLTGMGSDGAEGARALHALGNRVWAESAESCVVYGMPQAVVNAGVAEQVATASELGVELARNLSGVRAA
jgi:two-component system, chemotaxis family, protein-glutamate methylesterase/glutaminase